MFKFVTKPVSHRLNIPENFKKIFQNNWKYSLYSNSFFLRRLQKYIYLTYCKMSVKSEISFDKFSVFFLQKYFRLNYKSVLFWVNQYFQKEFFFQNLVFLLDWLDVFVIIPDVWKYISKLPSNFFGVLHLIITINSWIFVWCRLITKHVEAVL